MILLFYAFEREIAPFKRRLRNRAPIGPEGLGGFSAELGSKRFNVVGHGIGQARARAVARRALDTMPRPEMIIATGVAGALSSGLGPGDLVLADRILVIRAEGRDAEEVIAVEQPHLRTIGRSLKLAGVEYATGAMLTAHRVLASSAEKRGTKSVTGAIAVDMETAAIAAEAAARAIPFIAIRAILDDVDEDVTGAEMADEEGRVRPLAATSYLMRNPGAMLKLPRMIRNLSRATAAIADALEAFAHDGKPPR